MIDLLDSNKLNKIFKKYKFSIVINLAAQAGVRYSVEHPEEYLSSNIIGFYNLINLCKTYKIDHLIYASSSSVYGNSIFFHLRSLITQTNLFLFMQLPKKLMN